MRSENDKFPWLMSAIRGFGAGADADAVGTRKRSEEVVKRAGSRTVATINIYWRRRQLPAFSAIELAVNPGGSGGVGGRGVPASPLIAVRRLMSTQGRFLAHVVLLACKD